MQCGEAPSRLAVAGVATGASGCESGCEGAKLDLKEGKDGDAVAAAPLLKFSVDPQDGLLFSLVSPRIGLG